MNLSRLLLLCLCLAMASLQAAEPPLQAGVIRLEPFPAPETRLDDLNGQPYALQEDRGSVVFVHFWASWCGPCRREMPAIQRMWQEMKGE